MFMSDFPWLKGNKRFHPQYMTYPISRVIQLQKEADINGMPTCAVVVAKSLQWILTPDELSGFCNQLTNQHALALLFEQPCAEEIEWLPQWMEEAAEQEIILMVLPATETYETVSEWVEKYDINLLSDPSYVHFHQELVRVIRQPYTLMELMNLLAHHVPVPVDLTIGRNFRPIARLNSLGFMDWTVFLKENQYEIFSSNGFHITTLGSSVIYILCINGVKNGPGVLILHSKRNKTISSKDFAIVRSIIPYLALALARENDEISLQSATKEDLLTALLQDVYRDPLQIRLMAAAVDLEYRQPRYVLVADYYGSAPERFQDSFGKVLARSGAYIMHTRSNRHVICILEGGHHSFGADEIRSVVERINHQLKKQFPAEQYRIAVGHVCHTLADLLHAYVDAKFALVMGSALDADQPILWYGDYMDYYLICSLWSDELMERIYTNVIEQLEEYDQEHNHQLLETLEMLVKYNFNINDVAQIMQTHRNTIYRRIERINEIVGEFLNNSDKKIILQIAVKMRTIFNIYDKLRNRDFDWGICLRANDY